MKKITFNNKEEEFLYRNEACRVATCHDDTPHVVPVSYIFDGGNFYFATDYETRKLENLKENNKIALAIDSYSSIGNKAVCIQGTADIIESGKEFAKLYAIFRKRFEWVREDPWGEKEAPFVRVRPSNKVSWGLK